ncbi:MAG TPA: 1,4-dihydroxy-6-naphthoate synthase [Verrucomicrobiae bacterium]|jgi:1,4-dihydroxy-6-naphthoate synthase|nr:1,4-dihydroxy-6-naphthoate synthase [Verrucomicrobiae bacterium]
MDDAPLSLAYSPCPNDTYIFAALTNGLIQDAPRVRVVLEDIENLNDSAVDGRYELTKVSYGAIPQLMDKYRILRSGGAMGSGCGPLLVARPGSGTKLEDFREKLVAIPGERTTAFMLLQLALRGRPPILQMRFDQIVSAVASGTVDAGLIIHESRFTYADAGLVAVADMGEWWESVTGLPIPLGAILVRDDIEDDVARSIDDAIRRSLAFARADEAAVMPYVREHAFEMSDEVMRKHIALYVNEFSNDLGELGMRAVFELFKRAHDAAIIPQVAAPVFV